MSTDAPHRAARPTLNRLVWALLALELLAHLLDLALGPWGKMHWEERFNARAGVQFACGHVEAMDTLQYRTFCGGCTAEALVAAPLFAALGPTVLVWKAIVGGFHMALTAMGALLVRRLVGAAAACAFVALIFAAPGWYLELSHTGWGNHFESTAFPLAAILLIAHAAGRGLAARLGLLFIAGGMVGLGLWFGQTSAWALPALLLAASIVGRTAVVAFGVGTLVGMLPLFSYYKDKPGETDASMDWWTGRQVAGMPELADWLGGPWLRDNLWDPTVFGDLGATPGLWWAALWALATLGMGRILIQWRWGVNRPPSALAAFLPLSLLSLVAVYWLRYDLWSNLPDPYANGAFNLRYRTPLVPLLTMSAALAIGWPWRRPLLRAIVLGIGGAMVLFGGAQRVGLWTSPQWALVGLGVYQHDGWPDKTVPTGTPPQPLRRGQGRPTDIHAALGWLDAHEDPLADCRLDHSYELGRRLGLRAADPTADDIAPFAQDGWTTTDPGPGRTLFAQGIARGLMQDSGEQLPHLSQVLDTLDQAVPGLGTTVGIQAGARAHRAFHPEQDDHHRAILDPRVFAGVCQGRGEALVRGRSEDGRRTLDDTLPEDSGLETGTCELDGTFANGVASEWASWGGCGSAPPSAWSRWAPETQAAMEAVWRDTCAQVRP